MIGCGGGWERSGATDGEGAKNGGVAGVRDGSKSDVRACGADGGVVGARPLGSLYRGNAVSPSTNGRLAQIVPPATNGKQGGAWAQRGPTPGLESALRVPAM